MLEREGGGDCQKDLGNRERGGRGEGTRKINNK